MSIKYVVPPISVLSTNRYKWRTESWIPEIVELDDKATPELAARIQEYIDAGNAFDIEGITVDPETLTPGQLAECFNLTEAQHAILVARDEARDTLSKLVDEFESKLAEAESLADKHNLTFNIYPTYGMGGQYNGEAGEWNPSSESC